MSEDGLAGREAAATDEPRRGTVPEDGGARDGVTAPGGRLRSIVLPALAFAALAGFLLVLAFHVPRLDLSAVIGFTLLLAAVDFLRR